jgi:hypothetical protein
MLSAATFRKWRLKFASYDGENLFRFHSENNNNKKKSNEQKGKVISWKEPNIKNTRVDINKR